MIQINGAHTYERWELLDAKNVRALSDIRPMSDISPIIENTDADGSEGQV